MLTDTNNPVLTSLKSSAACCALASTLLAATAVPAWAQPSEPAPAAAPANPTPQAQSDEPEEDTDEEAIVVTGTLIRRIAPTGSNVIGITKDETALSGATDSNAVLATLVPQSEGFMDLLEPGRGNALGITRVPVVRPSLRNLGDSFNGSGSPTLVLLDGHRIVPSGIEQSVVDVGIMPPGILERTEIILGGTSAVYGSDAVGGTINYITRKRVDDTRVAATYGIADDYWSTSADVSSGATWEGGGIAFAYSFGKNTNLLEGDRPDYAISHNYVGDQVFGAPAGTFVNQGRLTGLACEGYGHITIGTAPIRRFLSTTLEERANWCDLGYATYTPAQERHSGFVTFSQDVTNRIKFELSAFYSQRTTETNFGPFTSSVTVRSTNPYYRPVIAAGISPTANQTVAFSWGPIFGNDASFAETVLKVGQVSPSITVDLGSDWQVRFMGAYGKSKSSVDQNMLDTILVGSLAGGQGTATTLTTAINPYDILDTRQNRALFGNLTWHNLRDGIHQFYQARAVADGPLFTLPGGEVRVAIGVEWSKTDFKRRVTDATTHIRGPFTSASASYKSVFGEVNLPIVGPGNSMPGIHALTFAASARYDHYASFGGTFNPKLGATYLPVEWLTFRGNWGKSFRAPNAVDKLGSSANDIRCVGTALSGCTNFAVGVPTGSPAPGPNDTQLTLSGTNPNLVPETSTSWEIGTDIRPPFLPGLTLSATYFAVKFKDGIGFPPIDLNALIAGAPHLVTFCPCTAAQLSEFAARAPNGQAALDIVQAQGYNILYLRDNSITNLAARVVNGLDVEARYTLPTSFGSIDARVNGTWRLKEDSQSTPLAPVINELRVGQSRFRATFGLGATIGDFRAQATLQHRAGYDVDPAATRDVTQTHIGSYDLVNMAFRWNVDGAGPLTQDLALTFVINNVFNTAPPINRTTAGQGTNGSTIGRFFQFGIEKQF